MAVHQEVEGLLKEFGKFCKEKRREAEKSQLCAAAEIGFPNVQSISKIERGERCLPLKKVRAAAKSLNVDPEMLFDRVMAIKNARARAKVFND